VKDVVVVATSFAVGEVVVVAIAMWVLRLNGEVDLLEIVDESRRDNLASV